jgi:hypothetical protein
MKLIFEDLIKVLQEEFNINNMEASRRAQNIEAKLRVMQHERLNEETTNSTLFDKPNLLNFEGFNQ